MLYREMKRLVERDIEIHRRLRRAYEKEKELELREQEVNRRAMAIQEDKQRNEKLYRQSSEILGRIENERGETARNLREREKMSSWCERDNCVIEKQKFREIEIE